MTFRTDYDIYDALPISNDALERGGVELLRAGLVDEELFIMARRVFAEPAHWGYVLADVTRRLAALYAAESDLTEAKVSTAIAATFARSLRSGAGAVRKPAKPHPAKATRPHAKARAKPKPSIKAVARRKGARAKS
jgi:hypothetical protein